MIGESASSGLVDDIQRIASQREELAQVSKPRTLHLGPEHIHVDLDVHVQAGVTAQDLGELVHWLEGAVHEAHPEVQRISIRLV